MTWPWQVAVSQAGATSARRYVDDLTAWVSGPPMEGSAQAVAIWNATTAFATAAQLALNQARSGVFSGCDCTRTQLLVTDGWHGPRANSPSGRLALNPPKQARVATISESSSRRITTGPAPQQTQLAVNPGPQCELAQAVWIKTLTPT